MFIVTRKKGQKFFIDYNIEVLLLEIRSDKIRLGITAPKNVLILTAEEMKWENKQRQRQEQELRQKSQQEE